MSFFIKNGTGKPLILLHRWGFNHLPMQFDCSNHLKDGSYGPKMVLIPAGKFRMGDIQRTGYNNEQPLHEVSVERFAIGPYPVTVYEFKQFVNATGYKTEA